MAYDITKLVNLGQLQIALEYFSDILSSLGGSDTGTETEPGPVDPDPDTGGDEGGDTGTTEPGPEEEPDTETRTVPGDLTVIYADEIAEHDNAWAWMKYRISNIDYSDFIIGDYIPMNVTRDGETKTYLMRVAGIDTYYKAGNKPTPNHIDFISKEVSDFGYEWGINNNGIVEEKHPWVASDLYDYLNDIVLDELPEEVQNVIDDKLFLIEERYSDGDVITEPTACSWIGAGKLWIPAEIEVSGTWFLGSNVYGSFGCQYPIFSSVSDRIMCEVGTDDACDWATMTPVVGTSDSISCVCGDGRIAAATVDSKFAVPICFRICAEDVETEEPEPTPEPEPDEHYGNLTILKEVDGDTEATDFAFEISIGDSTQTFTLAGDDSKTFENIVSGTEYTITETDSKEADSVSYSVNDDDPIEGTSYTGVIGEDEDTDITFINTYSVEEEPGPEEEELYLELNPDHSTVAAGFSPITIVITTNGEVSVDCDCDKIEWELLEPSGFFVTPRIQINSSEESVEDYTAIFTITATLDDQELTATYTLTFTGSGEPEPDPEPEPEPDRTEPVNLEEYFEDEITESYDGDVWAWLKDRVVSDDMGDIIEGDWINLDLNTITTNKLRVLDDSVDTYTMEVAGIDPYYDDLGYHHIDMISKELASASAKWNSDGYNNGTEDTPYPWLASDMYKSLNENVYNILPDNVKNVIIKKYMLIEKRYDESGIISNSNGSGWEYIGYLWLPNEVEVFGERTYSSEEYGAYGKRYATFDGAIERRIVGTTGRSWWWTLSPHHNASNTIISVDSSGNEVAYSASASRNFLLCFRVGELENVEPTPEPEPEPDKVGTLSITKSVSDTPVNTPDRGTYKFELTVGDGEAEEIEIGKGETVEKEIKADTEFTLKEVNSEEADMVTYTVDDGDSVEGDTVTGTVEEDGTVNIGFRNTYLYFYQSSNSTTMKANSSSLFIVLNTNGTPTVTCDNEEMIEWELSGKTIRMLGSQSSTEDYTVVFTIVCTLDNGKSITGTYTILFTADLEPEPDKTGTLTITKKTEVSPVDKTDKGTFKFELTVGDNETEEIELAAGDSVEKEILADTEFTLKEVESNDADMITYSVDGADSVEGDTVSGTVSEDGNISVDFLNRYIYLYLNPDHTTMKANSGTLTVILNTNGTPTVTCDNDEMVDWTLSGKSLKINGSKSSTEDYTAVFTITSALSNGAEIVGTYTIYFTADQEPEPEKTGTLSITKNVSDTNVNPPDRGTFKFELTVGDGETEEIELAKGDTVEKEIKADTEFTLKEIESNEADMVTYAVDGGDSIEGNTVTGSVGEDATVDVTFTNTYLYFYQSSNSSTMTAGNSVFIILNTNGTPSVTCDSNEDMIEWELSGKNLRILSSKSSPEDYTVTFTITCSLDNGKSIERTYSIVFKANEEKLEFDELSSTSATYVAGGVQPVTLVFSTNGEVEVKCECDKEIDWELKDPITGIVSIGYQLVINSTEKSDEDYDAVFTITSRLGTQEISQTFTLHLTASTD